MNYDNKMKNNNMYMNYNNNSKNCYYSPDNYN